MSKQIYFSHRCLGMARTLLVFFCCFICSFLSIRTVYAQLNGTYTIGGTNGDYASFAPAINALEMEGTSGPVVFNVRPGIYHEQLILDSISGVTFQGETGDSTDVVLEYDGEYVVLIEDESDITFRHMTLTGSGEVFRIRGVEERIGNITLENNLLKGGNTVISVYNPKKGVYAGNHVYRNNFIVGEGAGISKTRDTHVDWFTGGRLTDSGLVISGNIIQVKGTAINLYAQENVVIKDNQITVAPLSAVGSATGVDLIFVYQLRELNHNSLTVYGEAAMGIKVNGANLPHHINKNRIMLPDGGLGLSIEFTNRGWSSEMLVSNNMISVKGNDGSIGLRMSAGGDAKFYYNSILIYGEDTTSKALDIFGIGDTDDVPFFNNIYANKAGGYAVYVGNAGNDEGLAEIISSDYNNFYSSGQALAHWQGRDIADLSQWQNIIGLDVHSLSVDPQFQSTENLVPLNQAVDNAGIPVAEVNSDINGRARELPPTIGAVELQGHPPVVSAGEDKILSLNTNFVWLRGTAIRVDGRFTAFRWEKISGPSVSMAGERTANVQLSNLEAGEYVFRFSATDDKGRTGSDEVSLRVEQADNVPTVNAGKDQSLSLPVNGLWLNGIAFPNGGRFVAFRWEKISGPSVTMEGERTANLSLSDLQEGEYVFRFSATDSEGATGTDEVTIIVEQVNQVPVVSAGSDATITTEDGQYYLRGTGYDPDGRFTAFRWEKVSGPSVTMNSSNTANLKITDFVEGEYLFRFYATDNKGATSSDDVKLRVVGPESTGLMSNLTSVAAYPNTFKSFINVEVRAAEPEEYRIMLFDMLGKTYYQSSFVPDAFNGATHTINFSGHELKEGIYLIRVENKKGGFRKTVKVVNAQ